jgi:hypothetical protein
VEGMGVREHRAGAGDGDGDARLANACGPMITIYITITDDTRRPMIRSNVNAMFAFLCILLQDEYHERQLRANLYLPDLPNSLP